MPNAKREQWHRERNNFDWARTDNIELNIIGSRKGVSIIITNEFTKIKISVATVP